MLAPVVLHIDACQSDRDFLHNTWASYGDLVTMISAEDGESGIDTAAHLLHQHEPLRLIITDVQVPRIPGHDVIRILRKHPQLQVVPIVVLASSHFADEHEQSLSAGAYDHLIKPTSLSQARLLVMRLSLIMGL